MADVEAMGEVARHCPACGQDRLATIRRCRVCGSETKLLTALLESLLCEAAGKLRIAFDALEGDEAERGSAWEEVCGRADDESIFARVEAALAGGREQPEGDPDYIAKLTASLSEISYDRPHLAEALLRAGWLPPREQPAGLREERALDALTSLENDLNSLYWHAEGEGPQESPGHITEGFERVRAALASPDQESERP